MIALLVPVSIIHLRNGYFRVGTSRAGIAFRDTGWRRRLVLPLALQRRLSARPEPGRPAQPALRADEVAWIAAVAERQRAFEPGRMPVTGAV
jgi:hypothetical protein